MQLLLSIVENLLVIVLTIVVLVGGLYMFLATVQWILKLRYGSREQEGLSDLWQASMIKRESVQESPDRSKENAE